MPQKPIQGADALSGRGYDVAGAGLGKMPEQVESLWQVLFDQD